jgi:site-specific DNA-cytosine methylase
MLAMGLRTTAVAAEHDKDAVGAASSALPGLLQHNTAEGVKADHSTAALKRREYRAIIISGGSPRQGKSVLNKHRKCFDDPRSQQPHQLERLGRKSAQLTDIPVLI